MSAPYCTHCGWRPIIVKQRCRSCYEYRRRHGHDRPAPLVIAHVNRITNGYSR